MIKNLMRIIIKHIRFSIHRSKWREKNPHNKTEAKSIFPIEKVSVGSHTYGDLDLNFFGGSNEKVKIGNFCSIAEGVKILAGGGHEYNHLTTYPLKVYFMEEKVNEAVSKGPVIIEDDVWIGHGALILSGVTIGQGAIIGAGSVVTKDVPAYAIYAGNRVIKYRFGSNIIENLKKFSFSSINDTDIKENLELLYSDLEEDFFESEFYKKNIKLSNN